MEEDGRSGEDRLRHRAGAMDYNPSTLSTSTRVIVAAPIHSLERATWQRSPSSTESGRAQFQRGRVGPDREEGGRRSRR